MNLNDREEMIRLLRGLEQVGRAAEVWVVSPEDAQEAAARFRALLQFVGWPEPECPCDICSHKRHILYFLCDLMRDPGRG